jgi:hypothetical protein
MWNITTGHRQDDWDELLPLSEFSCALVDTIVFFHG